MIKIKALHMTAMILVVVGGLNWGLVGVADFNLVDTLFGEQAALSRTIYVLVGLSALWVLFTAPKMMKGQS